MWTLRPTSIRRYLDTNIRVVNQLVFGSRQPNAGILVSAAVENSAVAAGADRPLELEYEIAVPPRRFEVLHQAALGEHPVVNLPPIGQALMDPTPQ